MPCRLHFFFSAQLVSVICNLLDPIQCYSCYLMIWVLFPFYSKETKSHRSNLSKVILLDSDNAGI